MIQQDAAPDVGHKLPRLNDALNRKMLADAFAARGRIHIPDVLTPDSAQRVQACLKNETPYSLCFNNGGAVRGLSNPTQQQRQEHSVSAWKEVGLHEFRFLFDLHPLSLDGEPYPDPGHYWAGMVDFLNGPEFLDFARGVTGIPEIDFVDAQATLYRSGNFLTAHDDNTPGTKRLAGYVLSFTSVWRPEWGGLLEFLDSDSRVEAGYCPDFNTLKIFRVPMMHYVSIVAPFAGAGRYSIIGWFRAR